MTAASMPDPERAVKRNVSHLKRLGYGELEALAIVAAVARNAAEMLAGMGSFDVAWLVQVREIAVTRAERLMPTARERAEGTRESVRDNGGN